MLNEVISEIIRSLIADYLTGPDVHSLLQSGRLSHLVAGHRQCALAAAYVNSLILKYGPYRYCRYREDLVPDLYRHDVVSALITSYRVDGTDGLSLAYCCRRSLWMHWDQLIQSQAHYSQTRTEVEQICTEQVANRVMITDGNRFLHLIRDRSLLDKTWHRAVSDLIMNHFTWESSIFYDGNLDHGTDHDRDCRYQLLQFMLEHGADPSRQPNHEEMAPLLSVSSATHSGVSHGSSIQSLLLQHGSDPNLISRATGMTPLQIASVRAHYQIVSALIQAGADPNGIGLSSGLTPLHHVANCLLPESRSVLQLLVSAGADLNAVDHDTLTPMHFAATRDNYIVVDGLCDLGASLSHVPGSSPWSPAFFAIINGGNRVLRVLLDHGLSPNSTGLDSKSLLHAAVECQNLIACRMLIEANANLNHMDNFGMSVLRSAVYRGNTEAAEILIQHGARLELDILHAGARLVDESFMKILLRACPDPDAADLMGKTALMYAARFGNAQTTQALVQAGVDINRADRSGFTALFYARAYGNVDVEDILVAAGAIIERTKKRLVQICGSSGLQRTGSAVLY